MDARVSCGGQTGDGREGSRHKRMARALSLRGLHSLPPLPGGPGYLCRKTWGAWENFQEAGKYFLLDRVAGEFYPRNNIIQTAGWDREGRKKGGGVTMHWLEHRL